MKRLEKEIDIILSESNSLYASEFPKLRTELVGFVKHMCVEFTKYLLEEPDTDYIHTEYETFLNYYNKPVNIYPKCIISIMNWLTCDDLLNINHISYINMIYNLKEHGHDLESFTVHIAGGKMWNESPNEFFLDTKKAIKFFSEKLINYIS